MLDKETIKSNKLPTQENWFRRNLTRWNVEKVDGEYLKFRVPRLKYFKPLALTNKSKKTIFKVHYTSDPDLIWNVLRDPSNDLSLSHYDNALSDLERPISLLLGENQRQNFSWKIFAKALSIETGEISEHLLNEPLQRQKTQAIEKLTKEACLTVLSGLKNKKKFNIVRDFGYIIPYRVGLEFTGLKEIQRTPVFTRLFAVLRNCILRTYGSGRLKIWSKNGSADTFLLWTAAMFAQIFGNPGNLSYLPRLAASWGASNYYKNIEKSFANSDNAPCYSLLKRLLSVEKHFVFQDTANNKGSYGLTPTEYRDMSICLLLEVMTSFHILIGMSFSNIWKPILENEDGITSFIVSLKAADEIDKRNGNTSETDKIINRILSKNSTTTMLYRVARQSFPEYGIKQGDYLCFRIKQASKHVVDASKALNFGPHEKCPYSLSESGEREFSSECLEKVSHPCFGQFWARTVLKTMFLTLHEEIPNFRPLKNEAKQLLGLPELLMVGTGRKR